ncbi:MAG TPA: DUF4031 domain-containing protein [Phycisphaerales bacterium]|nr:DUF4031 domain-containing protein [Phycisphaerales bacterium]|tara:strand:+ start:59953 stop:60267 length:315 start_codon:yes stop_codon:yes gene_type:complete
MIGVDKLRDWGWRYGKSCHLLISPDCDLDELHRFAQSIGLKRSWAQKLRTSPHYDLTASKRALAVQAGAKELTDREAVDISTGWRKRLVAEAKARMASKDGVSC